MIQTEFLGKKLDLTKAARRLTLYPQLRGSGMRAFICGFFAETNSFSPIPTGREAFAAQCFFGDATQHEPTLASAPLHVWRQAAVAQGLEVVEGLCASAEAGGPLSREVYEDLRDELLIGLRGAGAIDIVLLSLHGSMIAQGYDDCEGDLISRVRDIVGGDAVIGVELDLHCSVTRAMQAASDVLVTYKHSPHTDIVDRAHEVFSLALASAKRAVKPVMLVHDCRMVSTWPTDREPMASFVEFMQAVERREGVLSVSFVHGFGLADVPEGGAKVIVITDGDAAAAKAVARELAARLWEMRHQTARTWQSLAEVVAIARDARRLPVVVADFCDNPGGGAPGDATHILEALLVHGVGDFACGLLWDPGAVALCIAAGEGAELELRIGGKVCSASGRPLDLAVQVRRIIRNARQPFGGASEPIGDAVWVSASKGVDLVLCYHRKQTFHPEAFTQFGIDLYTKRAIVVKSSNHFRAGFAPIAAEILFPSTDGLLTLDYASVPYRKFSTPFWPRLDDPFS